MEDERDHNTSPPSLPYLSEQLANSTLQESEDIPVIDLSVSDDEFLARAMTKASEVWGLFQVVNHGIPAELMTQMAELGKQFFELPEAEKEDVAKEDGVEGFKRNYLEGINAWDEHIFFRLWPTSLINYKYWPKNPPQYREVVEEYTEHMRRLTDTVLGLLSEGLGLPRDKLTECLGGETTDFVMRVNYYPPTHKSELAIGAAPHTDLGAIALLVPNGVQGLQAFKDEQWLDLHYVDSAVVIIIGDTLMRMTNGRFNNIYHRAKSDKDKMRMSWPVFVGPRADIPFGPLPELTGDENPPKFETLTSKEYVEQKIKGWALEDLPVYKKTT